MSTGSKSGDIRVRAESDADARIRESQQRFRALVNASSDVVYLMDPDWREIRQLDGRGFISDVEQPKTDWIEQYIEPDDQPTVREAIDHAIATKSIFELEHRVRRLDGTLGWAFSRAVPLLDESGRIVEWLGTAKDVTENKRAQEALRQTAERLQQAQSAAQIGTWEWDPAEDKRVLSPELYRIYGIEPGEPGVFEKFLSRVHPDDRAHVQRSRELGAVSGSMEYEFRYQHPELGLRWLYAKGGRAADNARLFGMVQDITERKSAEQALRESEQRFRVLTEAMPVMVWMAGTDKLCYYFNQSWLDFVGRTLEQEQGNGWTENVHPDDFDRCLQTYVTAFDTRRPFQMEYRLRHHTGQYRWILDSGIPRHTADGIFEGYVGGCLDIQDQKIALVASMKLAAIVESSDDAIISKDLNGIVTSWNPCAERMFGYSAPEMIGRSILTIIPPELHHDEERILSTIARGDRIQHFETVRMTKSGDRIDVSLTVSPVKDANGKIIGAAKIARDITRRKKQEQALRTSERLAAVGRLAATIAHEINNPLEAVTNYIYLARTQTARDDVRTFLAGAEEELQRVAHLTKQTLGFYRDTQIPTRMTLGAIVHSLAAVFAPRSRNKGVALHIEVRQDPEIQMVGSEVRQLVANLLSNSIDAVNDGGRIRVRVSAVHEYRGQERPGVRLTIADSGSGIVKTARPMLFEPFFTTKKDVGTGLGLWICKSIVEKHHGSIRYRTCTAPGKSGTVFSVFLPIDAQEITLDQGLRAAV